jgi:hypothetical protein
MGSRSEKFVLKQRWIIAGGGAKEEKEVGVRHAKRVI